MSTFGSSIAENNRLVLKNPDGTYIHCYKAGEKDSTYEQQSNKQNAQDNLTISDSELQYIVDNYDQFDQGSLIEEFLSILKRNQIIFILLLTVEMSISLFLLFITWKKREASVMTLERLYKDLTEQTRYIIFYVLYFSGVSIDVVFYPLGFYSLYSKKYKMLNVFSYIALYSGIITIFVIYINMLFLILFIMRLVLYTFSRFIVNLVISILVLPHRMQNNTYNTI